MPINLRTATARFQYTIAHCFRIFGPRRFWQKYTALHFTTFTSENNPWKRTISKKFIIYIQNRVSFIHRQFFNSNIVDIKILLMNVPCYMLLQTQNEDDIINRLGLWINNFVETLAWQHLNWNKVNTITRWYIIHRQIKLYAEKGICSFGPQAHYRYKQQSTPGQVQKRWNFFEVRMIDRISLLKL